MLPNTMSRAEKGRVAAPPALKGAANRVATAAGKLAGVVAQAHWQIGSQTIVDGVDFYVGEEELGHIHLDGEAHVPIGARLAKRLIAAGLASAFPWAGDFVVADTADVATSIWLFELRRAQIAGASEATLRATIDERCKLA